MVLGYLHLLLSQKMHASCPYSFARTYASLSTTALLPKLPSNVYRRSEILPNLQTKMFACNVFMNAIWKHKTCESDIKNNLSVPEIASVHQILCVSAKVPISIKENWGGLNLAKPNSFLWFLTIFALFSTGKFQCSS